MYSSNCITLQNYNTTIPVAVPSDVENDILTDVCNGPVLCNPTHTIVDVSFSDIGFTGVNTNEISI